MSDQKKSENQNSSEKHLNGSSSATSLFTIDSILAKQNRYSDTSPSSSPNQENSVFKSDFSESSPSRASRLPPATLFQHHPGLHITHLASNFGSPEFLGEYFSVKQLMNVSQLKRSWNVRRRNAFSKKKKEKFFSREL